MLAALFAFSLHAQVKGQDYTVDGNGDVIVARIVEGLPLQKNEICIAALNYLENAYKDTKYKIVTRSPENGVVAGEGAYQMFHEANYFPYSYFLDAPILLRVDAKDGRARVSVVLTYYTGKRSNINETIDVHDRISDFYPVKEGVTEHRKLYSKAFPILYEKVQKTIGEVVETLKSTRSSAPDTDW